jgi:hypothetical protein
MQDGQVYLFKLKGPRDPVFEIDEIRLRRTGTQTSFMQTITQATPASPERSRGFKAIYLALGMPKKKVQAK